MRPGPELSQADSGLRPFLWRLLGTTGVGLGAVGVFVPLLPTTPFLLVAAWAYARGSQRWHRWLVEHPRFGPPIRAWRESRAIPFKAKVIAVLSLLLSLLMALWLSLPPIALGLQMAALIAVSVFILTRPTAG